MEQLLKLYLPLYLLFYIAAAFVVPTYRTWKSTGINPVTFGKEDTAHNYVGFVMKLFVAILFIAVLFFAIGLETWLIPIHYIKSDVSIMAGLVLIHVSLLWISIAQYQMSNSWRIGIDEVNKTDLRTTGLFQVSRNPIFLGMLISLFGLFLIIPNAVTLLCLVVTYFIIQIQIRLEEDFLQKQHGYNYKSYCERTRRFL